MANRRPGRSSSMKGSPGRRQAETGRARVVRLRCRYEHARNVAAEAPASYPACRTKDASQQLCAADMLRQLLRQAALPS